MGAFVGDVVGAFVGDVVGTFVGDVVGTFVGDVGARVGALPVSQQIILGKSKALILLKVRFERGIDDGSNVA